VELHNEFTHVIFFELHFMIGHHAKGKTTKSRKEEQGKEEEEEEEEEEKTTKKNAIRQDAGERQRTK